MQRSHAHEADDDERDADDQLDERSLATREPHGDRSNGEDDHELERNHAVGGGQQDDAHAFNRR